ncbi:hypothetical protein DL89DRAFT_264837 [Linderina pennispora]|uniref:Uncharacterized protein n=1 Tax=Linderina pennispora TaxID=61395 RepID=A0A1Y1WGI2_9FUNG|nr:uncharacterized protein DL89DRAFT_264837 [Linderina pennispora]ORX72619.1 hypothetical protein DL89DRAFT_264837 [Linderina pennispora]
MRAFTFLAPFLLATLSAAAPTGPSLSTRQEQNPAVQKMVSCGVKKEDIDGLTPIAEQFKENVTTDGLETLTNILGHVASSVGSGPFAPLQIALGVTKELTRDVNITPQNLKQLVSFVGDNLENLPCLVNGK